jgi:hypothetical protein
MIPVYLSQNNGRQGYGFDEFSRKFFDICDSHRRDGRALAFAFILYSYSNPEVRKVLDDKDYWDALDEISGNRLSVYSFISPHGRKRQQPIQFLTGVRLADLKQSKAFVEEYFKVDLFEDHPSILFFQVSDNKVSDACLVKITAKSVENCFDEIKNILKTATDSIKDIQPEFSKNSDEIFQLIKSDLFQRKGLIIVKNAIKAFTFVSEFVSALKERI